MHTEHCNVIIQYTTCGVCGVEAVAGLELTEEMLGLGLTGGLTDDGGLILDCIG